MALLFLVAYKAVTMSITHDEAGTTDLLQSKYLDVLFAKHCFTNANNHIINTLLMKLSVACFGHHVWSIRLPNILAFIVYFLGTIWFVKLVTQNKLLQLAGIILLNTNLFLLDFFSVCRGYGLANAFEMISIAAFIFSIKNNFSKGVFITFLFASLAVYTNFTWINFYLPLSASYCLMLYLQAIENDNNKLIYIINNLKFPILFTLILIALCYIPIQYLQQCDEFKWGANGWFDAEHTLAKDFLYNDNFILAVIFQIIFIAFFLFSAKLSIQFFKIKQLQFENKIIIAIVSIIFFIVIATILQRNIFNTRYINGRKATMYISLLLGLLFLLINYYYQSNQNRTTQFTIAICIVSMLHFCISYQCNSVKEWRYDCFSKNIINELIKKEVPINVAVSWQFWPSFTYYNRYELLPKIKNIYRLQEIPKDSSIAYYYILDEHKDSIPANYILIKQLENRYLYKKEKK